VPEPEKVVPEPPPLPTKVQTVVVTADENNMRVDRFLEARFPACHFPTSSASSGRAIARQRQARRQQGPAGRRPERPHSAAEARHAQGGCSLSEAAKKTLQDLKAMILFEDADVMVLNKPAGLAVQGGSGITRNVDDMLEVMRDAKGRSRAWCIASTARLGCLLIAKTRFAATAMTGSFRHRSARKVYWALVAGVPKPKQGRISTYLAKEESETYHHANRRACDEGASHAVTYYALVERRREACWVSLKPVRPHPPAARAHGAHQSRDRGRSQIFQQGELQLPGGMQNRLHLLARRIVIRIRAARDRCHRTIAAAHAAILESARARGQQVRPIENAPEE